MKQIKDIKEMEIYQLLDKEFKISVLKMISELKENTDKQINKLRKKTHEQNENISEIETMKNN